MPSLSLLLAAALLSAPPPDDGAALRAYLRDSYPSLAYVDRYRREFPAEIQGTDALWSAGGPAPTLRNNGQLVDALLGLQDQHVALAGAAAGKTESLGVLFRSASDGSMVVWRVFDAAVQGVSPGDVVEAVDGVPTADWLGRAAARTNGGNRRSRAAEAALQLGLGTRVVHEQSRLEPLPQMAGLGLAVELRLRTGGAAARDVKLSYAPMSAERASALTAAVNSADLPGLIDVDGVQVGTLRLGAFAPQYDPVFSVAADKAAELPGSTEDQAMLAGFCAVTREFIGKVNEVNHRADVLVLDLRGNMGGFGREARLLAAALGPAPLPATFDVFANHKPGTLLLKKQVDDPSCGSTDSPRPIVVLTDAGTRSAGELMATWLWASGAVVVGERTIGAGGGRDADGDGFELPGLGLKVKTSGNFNVFDASKSIADGEVSEAKLVDLVAQDHFAPSRNRPFAIQAAGLRPDLETPTTLADLRDGGLAQVGKAITVLRERHLLATSPCKSPTQKVDEEGFVQIGGIEQWVTVKGDSCASPIILFISGGPGNPLSPLSDTMYGAWARDFILVQWDQRGAGMTYGRSPPAGDSMLTLKQMNDDGTELAAYLAHRFGKQKVILWGSSWGSILGVHMAKSHPELFHAYLGTSQLVNFRENQAISYAKLLTLVRASDDAASLAVLEGVGTPPWTDPRSFGKVRRVIRKYEAKVSTPPPAAWQPAAEYQTPKAQADYEAGEEYSFLSFVGMKGDGMASKVDLPALGTDFAIPMFFVEGKQDLLATPDVAQRYYQRIKAPQKDLVLLEHAGHDPNQDVIDAEYKLLKERILPLAR